jgi:uncharacterized protein YbjQ (UPF0145 family)
VSVTPLDGAKSAQIQLPPKPADQVTVTENDITDRPYTVLGDISVSVAKNNIFESDPTREEIAGLMQKKAADMGADAVVLARYGAVGISAFSWGKMDGRGRAVLFTK